MTITDSNTGTDTTATDQPLDNGVDVAAILEARAAMAETPAAAAFRWRATSEWVTGIHTRTQVHDYFGAGDEQSHHTTFSLDTDHPELFAADDHGPTPVEMLLVGLAGCLTGGIASVATHRGIELRSVTATLEGEMDLRGVLGIDPDVRNGFNEISVRFEIDANASQSEIEALVAQSQKRSAVFDALTNPTNVVVDVV
ncbi:MAG: OsmC family protein [Ilumatobacter sp.]|nr:OsmC family protein [Ilumatobacter sp.]